MAITELCLEQLDPAQFVSEAVADIAASVGDGTAVNALSGGVDSSVVTVLGHRALGSRLKTFFVDSGLMRRDEPQQVRDWFAGLGIPIEIVDAQDAFFQALRGLTDPEDKREAVTQTFYRKVFGGLVRASGARHLLQGSIYTDVEETVAGIKRQHNILSQLGIDTEAAFGYRVVEPLIRLRKPAVRAVGRHLGLPADLYARPPFPGPALAARVIGEVTPERVAVVRQATALVEQALEGTGAFQYLAILHEDRVTGMRNGKRDFGLQIEVRCWESQDAQTAAPTRLSWDILGALGDRIAAEVPGVVSVTYNIARKPPSTIEAV